MKTFDPKGARAAPVLPSRAVTVPQDMGRPPRRMTFLAWMFGRGRTGPERLPEVLPASHDPPGGRACLVTPSAASAAGGPAIMLRF